MDVRFYLLLFLRRIHWFLLFAILGTAIGLTLAVVLPPTYSASSTLIVESQQIPTSMAASTVQTEAIEALQIIQQQILTRDKLLELANRLNVYTSEERAQMTGDEIVRDLRGRIGIFTRGGGGGGGGRPTEATIVEVSFEAPRAPLSAAVTNEIVSMILQQNVALRTDAANETLAFFDDEVDRLDRELSAKNAEILAFQEQNLNALPDSLDFRRAQQSAAQARLAQLERDQALLQDRRDALVKVYEETGRVTGVAQAQLPPEQQQLQQLQSQLASALVTLSPQNPRVRLLQSQIAALEAQIAQAGTPSAPAVDPQQAALQIQLTDIDTQIDAITREKGILQQQMTTLQASIDATPANAIRLATLQRDAAALQAQYNQAVASRAQAVTGETIEALSKGQRITVVEPAIPPAEPVSPNRPAIAAAGIGGGIALGLGVVLAIEFLKNAVRRPIDIESKLGIRPLGTLPYIQTRAQILRRRAIIGSAFAVVAVGVPVALWWVHTYVTPLDLLFERVLDQIRVAALVAPNVPGAPNAPVAAA